MITTQITKNFNSTNQNLTFLDKDVLISGNNTFLGKECLTFKILESLERNYNSTQNVLECNRNKTMGAIDRIQTDIGTRIETNHGDSKFTTVNMANTVHTAIQDSRSINQKNIINAKSDLHDNIVALTDRVQTNAVEERSIIYKQAFRSKEQNLDDFGTLNSIIMDKASDIQVDNHLGFTNTTGQIYNKASQEALAYKHIQILKGESQYDELKFAAENASNLHLDTTQQTEKLAHHIQESDLEALKRKECLAQQILKKELDIIRSEIVLVCKMKKGCCETKEKVDKRATYTHYKLKDQDINRLKDELTEQEIWDTNYFPHCHEYNTHNRHNENNEHNRHNENNRHNTHNEHNEHNEHNCNRG